MKTFSPGMPLAHFYGQYIYHSPATIRGNSEALIALRDAIDAALATGTGNAAIFAADGEGYAVEIHRVNTMKALGTPEYIYQKEFLLGWEKAQRDREFRLSKDRNT